MPAIVETDAGSCCSKCLAKLESEALKCARRSSQLHLRCSDLPVYLLLRYKTSQAQYVCRACVLAEGDPTSLKEAQEGIEKLLETEEKVIREAAEDSTSIVEDVVNSSKKTDGNESTPNTDIVLDENSNSQKKDMPICKYYLRRECQFGRLGKDCKFQHPRICQRFSKNGDRRGGCKKGRNCSDHHPKACHQSMERKECSRDKCRFYHLNGT